MMAVHAHPDDESSKGAATMAKYVAEGAEVMVVTCTGGERGDILNPAVKDEVEQLGLAEVRRREMQAAASILGVRHEWLGFMDSGYPEGDPQPPLPEGCFAAVPVEEPAEALARIIAEFKPHVVTTYDENGGYPHPDHIRCHEATIAAIDLAAHRGQWEVPKVYYNQQFTLARVRALHLGMIDADLESPYHDWLQAMESRPDDAHRVTTRIPAADFFGVREEALRAHRTQVDPDGMWFAVPLEMHRSIWPTEEFELARSRVPVTEPEDDLFDGLRG